MATSEQLRTNTNQHKPKNTKSKQDDKIIYLAQGKVKDYLYERFAEQLEKGEYYIQFDHSISFKDMQKVIRDSGIRHEFDTRFLDRTIKPDGGVLVLKSYNDTSLYKIILVAEVKRQGTNDKRKQEEKRNNPRATLSNG